MSDPSGVQGAGLRPHGIEELGAQRVRGQRVELTSADVLHGEDHRSIGQPDEGAQVGTAHAGTPGEEEEQSLVLHRALQRATQPFIARIAEQQRAVAAVQQVGVPAVSGVDLDECGRAVPQGGAIELRPPSGRPLEGECRH